jgi:two-component system sensor histidine kinase BaeS
VDDKIIGYLTLLPSADPSDAIAQAFLADQKRQLLQIALFCVLLSALAAAVLATHFRRPIRDLVKATGELMRGRFETRIEIERSDELGTLAEAVNQLAMMLEQHEASRRQWVADTSHELRTPLAVLNAQIEALLDGVRQPGESQFLAMQRQVAALEKLVSELHELARADVGQLTHKMLPIHPWEVVLAEAESFRDRFVAAGLNLRIEHPELSPEVAGDAARLQQVVGNLLENSLRYTDSGGGVLISARVEKGRWILCIDDTAPGVPDDALHQLGTRFFRVERSRNRALGGSGLGLALSQRIAEAHGGKLQFSHSQLGGLRATLSLPLKSNT